MPLQEQWRSCRKCGGLFHDGETRGRCPVGAAHSPVGSLRYALMAETGDGSGERPGGRSGRRSGGHGRELSGWRRPWRRCGRCELLFRADAARGVCPSGGAHQAVDGQEYGLKFAEKGELGWMRCTRCQGLHRPDRAGSRCAAGGVHDLDDDSDYIVEALPGGPIDEPAPEHARRIGKVGTWLRDDSGRYLLLRGVNFGGRAKLPPYLPVYPLDPASPRRHDRAVLDTFRRELERAREDLAGLRDIGCNVVRLLVLWKGLEPRVNHNPDRLLPEGEEYLHMITEIIEELYALGMYVFIDFHQDIAHEAYSGDGFPDWAIAVDERHPRPAPSSFRDRQWTIQYYDTIFAANRDLARNTLRSFWRNSLTNTEAGLRDFPVRNHFVRTAGLVAAFFRSLYGGQGHPAVLGYEIFNEPHQSGIDKVEFEREVLPAFYREVIAEIRRYDPAALILVQPRVDWTIYSPEGPEFQYLDFTNQPRTNLDLRAESPDDPLALSFHHYDAYTMYCGAVKPIVGRWGDDMFSKEIEWPPIYARLRQAAVERGMVPFLTEFGADQGWTFPTEMRRDAYLGVQARAYMDLQYRQVEAFLLNATYWNWDLYNSLPWHDNWNFEDFSLLGPDRVPRHVDVTARPYPRRSSAMPAEIRFDLGRRLAIIVLEGEVLPAPTELFVPARIHYPDGFAVRATGVVEAWDGGAQLLHWMPDPTREANMLVIAPPGEDVVLTHTEDPRGLLGQTLGWSFR